MEIGEKKIISLGYTREILKKIKEKRDLSYIEERTLKYIDSVYKLSQDKEEKILNKLNEINIKDELKIQILTLLPKNEEELRAILYTNTLAKEDMEKILNIIKDV
ncbi:DNA-directed RNA polymerase subunit F [Nanobdella aerobiophila]|uniref:DNA-directed RNA polymerase subunit Rpo4 n=1 Tax=Nanobdella aerobiophila TaxID=2586965 RepID=A0A915SXP9_9ARCH|nr:hypothetical protein [Nanobdella aerobiophila]BBL45215.1 DNA-directed RNA polymerase subunit F [Nanobdella aerobiophila]